MKKIVSSYDFDVNGITEDNIQEMQHIKEDAQTNGIFMQTPNGKPSKLNERQWLQVRTKAFKQWFGDWENNPANASKVVDENGEPMVMYHGSLNNFSKFITDNKYITSINSQTKEEEKFFWSTHGSLGEGAYFTPSKNFAMQYTKSGNYGEMDDYFYEVFLNIKKPYLGRYNDEFKDKEDAKKKGYDGAIGVDDECNIYMTFNPSQIKSATLNNGNFDTQRDDIRFQFIGERGTAILDKVEEAAARMDNLRVAREMEAAERDAKTVKLATGWERGTDGKWRYEIDDIPLDIAALQQLNENRLNYNFRKRKPQPEYHAPLEDVITDKALVKALTGAYGNLPHLSFSTEIRTEGAYDNLRNSIDISTWVKGRRIKSVLAHEIQHWVQDREGFAVGSNTTGEDDKYWRTAGEVEARNAARRRNMTPDERRASLAAETEDVAREDQIFIYSAMGKQAMAVKLSGKNSHISTKPFTPISRKQAEALAGLLKKSGLAKDIVFDREALQQVIEEWGNSQGLNALKSPSGEIYGAVKDGVVYLDPTKLNANTPIHEFGHLWSYAAKKNNPQLWAKIVELTKETPYFKDLLENPVYANLKDDDARADEAFAQALGDEGERVFLNNNIGNTFKERFRNILRDFWKWTGEKLGIRDLFPEQISKLTFVQAVNGAVVDLTKGEVIKQNLPALKSIPAKIGKVELTPEQREKLTRGSIIQVRGLTDKSGETHTLNIRWNCRKNKIEFSNITVKQERASKLKL